MGQNGRAIVVRSGKISVSSTEFSRDQDKKVTGLLTGTDAPEDWPGRGEERIPEASRGKQRRLQVYVGI